MQEGKFFSVRMRAAKNGPHEYGGKHISGGELLSTYSNLKLAVNTLLEKGLGHSRGNPDFMQIQFESIDGPISRIKPLPIETNQVESAARGHALVRKLLERVGIQGQIVDKAYLHISEYSGISGAMLVDSQTGERIDERNQKGVRVSRMDWMDTNFEKWAEYYKIPKSSRVKEALVLATKVNDHPSTIAELCWSDDPEYVTGYVASKKLGYQRITKLKEYGDERGCRIFFVNGSIELNSYLHYLEKMPVWIQWNVENSTKIVEKLVVEEE